MTNDIEYYAEDDVTEVSGGRLIIGHVKEDGAPVYWDPTTGYVSFGCGILPVKDEESE